MESFHWVNRDGMTSKVMFHVLVHVNIERSAVDVPRNYFRSYDGIKHFQSAEDMVSHYSALKVLKQCSRSFPEWENRKFNVRWLITQLFALWSQKMVKPLPNIVTNQRAVNYSFIANNVVCYCICHITSRICLIESYFETLALIFVYHKWLFTVKQR